MVKQYCIIGAGACGLPVVKAFIERGIPFDCFEKGSAVGGNWRFENDNGMSSAYRSLHINTSRERMEYSDYPMPKSYPDFPHHTQIAAYFDAAPPQTELTPSYNVAPTTDIYAVVEGADVAVDFTTPTSVIENARWCLGRGMHVVIGTTGISARSASGSPVAPRGRALPHTPAQGRPARLLIVTGGNHAGEFLPLLGNGSQFGLRHL